MSNYSGTNSSSKGQRSRSLRTKVWKSFFAHIFVKSGSIYVKPRPKWSATHSTPPAEMLSFCDICL